MRHKPLGSKGRMRTKSSDIKVVKGDLLKQPVEVIVNAWNRNLIPWWLLLPQGVSRAIKKAAGIEPFKELQRHGAIPLGGAVLTGAGTLSFRGIIHAAGINLFWRASEYSIRESVRNVIKIVNEHDFSSVAFQLIGSGSGGFLPERALDLMTNELASVDTNAQVVVVVFDRRN
jgi:O-acetyl-ADP-ribose deacetylase (regulator of RNase III)